MISNELKSVLPLENAYVFKETNPIAKDGKIRFEDEAEEKQEDEMLKLLMKEKRARSFFLAVVMIWLIV